jgi:hypothetical protein
MGEGKCAERRSVSIHPADLLMTKSLTLMW